MVSAFWGILWDQDPLIEESNGTLFCRTHLRDSVTECIVKIQMFEDQVGEMLVLCLQNALQYMFIVYIWMMNNHAPHFDKDIVLCINQDKCEWRLHYLLDGQQSDEFGCFISAGYGQILSNKLVVSLPFETLHFWDARDRRFIRLLLLFKIFHRHLNLDAQLFDTYIRTWCLHICA